MEKTKQRHKLSRGALYFWLGLLVPALTVLAGYMVIKVWPFGDGTALIIDSLHQYLPFYTDFHEKLTSGDSLFYSWSAGLGYNFWATYAYYMASPLNFLMVLVPTANVGDFMDLMILLKIGLCGGTLSWYLHRRKPKYVYLPVVFATMYALGNFMIGYYFNLMWLDSIAMLPLIMYGIEQLVRGRGGKVYVLSLFYGIYCNYYIGFMLCIFSVLYYLTSLVTVRDMTWKKAARRSAVYALYSVAAGGMASLVLLPAYCSLASSEAMLSNTFPSTIRFYTNFIEEMTAHFAANNPINISDTQVGLNAYCGVAVLMLVICYILDAKIDLVEKIGKLELIALLLLSFATNVLNYIWHGFHQQNGLPNRFAFIYVLLLIVVCYDVMEDLKDLAWWKLITAGVVPLAFSLFMCVSGRLDMDTYGNWVYVTPALLAVYLIVVLVLKAAHVAARLFTVLLGSLLLTEAVAHGIYGMIYNENVTRSIYLDDQASYKLLVGRQGDTDFFRSEIDSQRMRNVTMFAGGHSMIMFNSTMLASVTDFCHGLGIEARTNKNGYNGVTTLLNDVFGIRYVLSSNGKSDSDTLYQFYEVDADDNLTLYKNDQALSIGFMVREELLEWDAAEGTPAEAQNQFVRLATGLEGIFKLDRTVTMTDGQTEQVKVPEGKQVYLYLPQRVATLVVDTPEYKKTYTTYTDHLYSINRTEDEDIASFTTTLKDTQTEVTVSIYTCPDDACDEVYEYLAASQLEDVKATGTSLSGTVEAAEDGLLLLTVPYENGWTAAVDGEETAIEQVSGTLMALRVSAGTHEIRLKFVPPGFNMGLLLSLLSLAVCIVLLLYERRYLAGVKKAEEERRIRAEEERQARLAYMEEEQYSMSGFAMRLAMIEEDWSAYAPEPKSVGTDGAAAGAAGSGVAAVSDEARASDGPDEAAPGDEAAGPDGMYEAGVATEEPSEPQADEGGHE